MTSENTLFDRAKLALGVGTSKEMAAKLGLAESSVSSWKSKDVIPAEHLKNIAAITKVSLDWLMLGEGGRYGDGIYTPKKNTSLKSPEEIIAEDPQIRYAEKMERLRAFFSREESWSEEEAFIGGLVREKLRELHNAQLELTQRFIDQHRLSNEEVELSRYIAIPCYDIEASAGNGSTFDLENIIDEVMFSRVWMHAQGLFQKDLVCIQVKGDSMAGLLEDGDTVLVNTARKHGDGVFVIRIGEQVRIKRLQWLSDGHVKLISENPAYENELIDPKQLGDAFQVLGAAHTKIGRLS